MKELWQRISGFIQDEEGASAVEYALLVAGIAVAISAAIYTLGNNIKNMFNKIASNIT